MRKVHVINFIASLDQHQPLLQPLVCQVRGKQIELVARQRRQQFVVQRTAKIFRMHQDILPGRSGRFPQGDGKTLREHVPRGKYSGQERKWVIVQSDAGLWIRRIQADAGLDSNALRLAVDWSHNVYLAEMKQTRRVTTKWSGSREKFQVITLLGSGSGLTGRVSLVAPPSPQGGREKKENAISSQPEPACRAGASSRSC